MGKGVGGAKGDKTKAEPQTRPILTRREKGSTKGEEVRLKKNLLQNKG